MLKKCYNLILLYLLKCNSTLQIKLVDLESGVSCWCSWRYFLFLLGEQNKIPPFSCYSLTTREKHLVYVIYKFNINAFLAQENLCALYIAKDEFQIITFVVWNMSLMCSMYSHKLTLHVKQSPTLSIFRTHLKTHLYPLAFDPVWNTLIMVVFILLYNWSQYVMS